MRYTLTIFLLFACLAVVSAFAQGEKPTPTTPPNQASDASFDRRLPPVLPGERINDSGVETKQWSTSGPVHVSEAPEPFKDRRMIDDFVANKGIIVDQRGVTNPAPVDGGANK